MKMGLLTKNRKVFIWCLFDWANSPYPTVILTFVFSAYFTKLVAEDEISGTFLWSQTIAFSGLFMAFIAPILGAISDETGKKKIWILVFSILAILATMTLWFVLPDKKSVPLALIAIATSLIAFEFCTIFYNATLIQVANSSSIGKVSGLGWAAGYIGAIICLLICLFQSELLGSFRYGFFKMFALPETSRIKLLPKEKEWFSRYHVFLSFSASGGALACILHGSCLLLGGPKWMCKLARKKQCFSAG